MICTPAILTTTGQPKAWPLPPFPPKAFLSSTLWMSTLCLLRACSPLQIPSPPWVCLQAWCPLQSLGSLVPASTAWITWTTWAIPLWILQCQRQPVLMLLQHLLMFIGTHVTLAWLVWDLKPSSTPALDTPVFRTQLPTWAHANTLWTDPCEILKYKILNGNPSPFPQRLRIILESNGHYREREGKKEKERENREKMKPLK